MQYSYMCCKNCFEETKLNSNSAFEKALPQIFSDSSYV